MKTATSSELASILGCSTRRITQLAAEGVMPPQVKHGTWDLAACVQAWVKHKVNDAVKAGALNDLDAERARLTMHKADMAEIELGLMRGKVFDGEAVVAVMADLISTSKARIQAIRVKCAGDVRDLVAKHAPPEVVEKLSLQAISECLDTSTRESLEELSRYDPAQFVDRFVQAHRPDVGAASEADDEPVGRSSSPTK